LKQVTFVVRICRTFNWQASTAGVLVHVEQSMWLCFQVTVVDVFSAESCICRTDDSQILDG